ncbi:MAG TPA: DUF1800 family protein [Rhizomicrobium sp.]|nr:DUF1800 family protein [Rhizomicrobium sp.]
MMASLESVIAVTRFGLGAQPQELQAASADPRGWLKNQIRKQGADQPKGKLPDTPDRVATLFTLRGEIKDLKQEKSHSDMKPEDFKGERKDIILPMLKGVRDEIFARTVLAAQTTAPFRERWTLFWANHFTVSSSKLQSAVLCGPFEREAIRPNVFGRFEDLLIASSTHPGMLIYLDQARSAGPDSMAGQFRDMGLNENLAREIMELHTVGADAGYTQADVTEFARALTGFSVGAKRDSRSEQGRFVYRSLLHEPGTRKVMGKTYADRGMDQAMHILKDLAAHPKTAEHISRKLAVHFVADDPPPSLIEKLKTSFLESRGDLSALASALIDAPEAWQPEAHKFKTPYEFIVSGYRAAGAAPADPQKEVVLPLTVLGQRPFASPQPNGWSDAASDWAAPGAMVKRLTWASRFAEYYTQQSASPVDAALSALGERVSGSLKTALTRAESRTEAFAILLMSPEFQRR